VSVHVFVFVVAHVAVVLFLGGFVVPKWFDIFVPPERLNDGVRPPDSPFFTGQDSQHIRKTAPT
jgi:solute carrier family 6 GABA transporter-like protein 1